LTIVLDTNPAAWSLLSDLLPLSSVVANLLVFINAHLACNYTNKVAVIASHCDKAEYLYPTPTHQFPPQSSRSKRQANNELDPQAQISEPTKRLKLNGPEQNGTTFPDHLPSTSGNKYRPFRLIESELLANLSTLLSSTSPSSLQTSTSTMIAGALTIALSYINRESIAHNESLTGVSTANATPSTSNENPSRLQARILLLTASPSTDLAHQYIPIMNAIFACQRLAIPIDILQFPLPSQNSNTSPDSSSNSTVFLQQASDATSGIFIPFQYPSPSASSTPRTKLSSQSLLTYLLTSLLPSPLTRLHLVLPTRIDVDFRAACFCHRRIIDTGFVCSICLSIFCAPPEGGDCLTCGNKLTLSEKAGGKPVVVARKKKKKKRGRQEGVGTPTVGTPVASGV
jgi:transcription initiation factor TFIIH subunit 3